MASSSGDTGAESADSVITSATNIIKSLDERFEAAKAAGDVLFFPSTVHRHNEGGVEVRLFENHATQHKSDTRHYVLYA